MNIQPFRTQADYERALQQIELLMDRAEPGTPEEDALDVLATLVEVYEAQHYPPDPIGALEHYLERKELTRKDLMPYIGAIGRVHEVMNRRRRLTLEMIRKLAAATGIPLTTLAQRYELAPYRSRATAGPVASYRVA